MIFTLLNVYKVEENGTVSGNFLQDHIGTLESAIQKAIDTEAVNHNAIDIAVVPNTGGFQSFAWYSNCTRLDKQRCISR